MADYRNYRFRHLFLADSKFLMFFFEKNLQAPIQSNDIQMLKASEYCYAC